MTKNLNAATAIVAIAAANPEGFTVDARTLEPIRHGYAVALADTQNSFNEEGAARVAAYIADHAEANAVGGWYDAESGRFYYDATTIYNNRTEAIEAGRKNGQIAIFDLDKLEEIRL